MFDGEERLRRDSKLHANFSPRAGFARIPTAIDTSPRDAEDVRDHCRPHGEIIGDGAVVSKDVSYTSGALDVGTIMLGEGASRRVLYVMNEYMAVQNGEDSTRNVPGRDRNPQTRR